MQTVQEIITEEIIIKDLNKISEILILCKKLFLDSFHMVVTSSSEKHTIIHRDKFLRRVHESFWKLAIIELTKIYGNNSDNDHYSILILINQMRKHHLTSSWRNKISSLELKEIKKKLKVNDIKKRITNLVELRNEHFAHTDKNPQRNKFDVGFYFEDSIALIEEAENIIVNLSTKLGKPISFTKYDGEEMDNFIEKHILYMTQAIRSK